MSKRKREDEGRQYYKIIEGTRYDKGMLDVAEAATGSHIDLADAKKLLVEIIDGDAYTATERATLRYIREHYKFSKTADDWLRSQITSWSVKRARTKKELEAEKKSPRVKNSVVHLQQTSRRLFYDCLRCGAERFGVQGVVSRRLRRGQRGRRARRLVLRSLRR